MKVKEFNMVLDAMDEGCGEYCSLYSCEDAEGWNEHFESASSFVRDMVSWGLYK